jgi:hypothetical protein
VAAASLIHSQPTPTPLDWRGEGGGLAAASLIHSQSTPTPQQQTSYCVGYTIYISTALRQLAPSLSLAVVIFLLFTPPLILLCAVPDLLRFLPFSAISNLVSFLFGNRGMRSIKNMAAFD